MAGKYDSSRDAEIVRDWKSGLSLSAIAGKYELSVVTIQRHLAANGVSDGMSRSDGAKRHYDKAADEKWPEIKQDLALGLSMRALRAKYGMTKARILDLCCRQGFDYDEFLVRQRANKDNVLYLKLSSLLDAGYDISQIAVEFDKSARTVSRYLHKFGLSCKADRDDISDSDVLADWNAGMSVNSIAAKYDCSHDTITKRLAKYDIHSERKSGIERHFDVVHDKDWDTIKSDLDACVPISAVAVRHGMRYEAVYRMMERHGYQYAGLITIDVKKLENRIESTLDLDEAAYLKVIRDYWNETGNAPVVYTLSRRMNRTMKTVRDDIVKYDLFEFIGSNNISVKVLRVLHDLDNLGIKHEQNNRKILRGSHGQIMEIDIWLPEYNLGIEINPAFTHSVDIEPFGKLNADYHQQKSLAAERADIGLIHLYDSDFIYERNYQVFLTQIRSMCGNKIRVGSRFCTVREICREESNEFLNRYHFQGCERNSFARYGLYFDGMLLGVMCFGHSRYTDDAYEIIRYCMHPDYIVHGCFDKLFSAFLKTVSKPVDIVSYMDLNKRLRAKSVYDKSGFEYVGLTPPDYVWYNQSGTEMKSRYSVMKKNLVKQGFDASKSEFEIMREQGYVRVFGAGSKRYVYHVG